jgi:cephalosporin hydroxylase
MPRKRILLSLSALILLASCRKPAAPPPPKPSQTERARGVWRVAVGDPANAPRIVRGIYPGNPSWRWTERNFAVRLDAPPWDTPTYLDADLSVPMELLGEFPNVTITARVNGVEVCRRIVGKDQNLRLFCHVPDSALRKFPAEVEIETDRSFPDRESGRIQSIIALGINFAEYENGDEFRERMAARAREGMERVIAEQRKLIPPDQLKQWLKLFHQLPVWNDNYYQGIQVMKNPLDLWMMERIIHEQKIDVVVETGTLRGGSALVFAAAFRAANLLGSRVVTIDINDFRQQASANSLWKDYVTFLHGSSTDPQIVAQAAEIARGRKVLVTLDSDHSATHVLKELRAYAPLVHSGGYLIVEDTHIDSVPTNPGEGPGPMAAVREFLASKEGAAFDADFAREGFVLTFNPGGWLRRK